MIYCWTLDKRVATTSTCHLKFVVLDDLVKYCLVKGHQGVNGRFTDFHSLTDPELFKGFTYVKCHIERI